MCGSAREVIAIRGALSFARCAAAPTSPHQHHQASLLYRFSGAVLYVFVSLALVLVVLSLGLATLSTVDLSELQPVAALLLMTGVLYWTSTLLPGPIKRLGKAARRRLVKTSRNQGAQMSDVGGKDKRKSGSFIGVQRNPSRVARPAPRPEDRPEGGRADDVLWDVAGVAASSAGPCQRGL